MKFSDEQIQIGDSLQNNFNVCTLATAGSGKTTSIKYIYTKFKPSEIIAMTFNKHLADESRSSISNFINSDDVCFYTVHSMGNQLYDVNCPDNNGLYKIIKDNVKIQKDISQVKIIIYDECQDMNDLFYEFIMKLIKDINNPDLRLCLLGDDKQCINMFTGASTKYILNPQKFFSHAVQGEWKILHLSTTYRLSPPIADFVNKVVTGVRKCTVISDDRIKMDKPDYVLGDMFSPKFFDHILSRLDKYANTNFDNVALICKSVKSVTNPVHRFVNYIKNKRPYINIYRTKSDDEVRDDKVTSGKLLVSSFHQMKGQERDVIIYFLFDDSFYNLNKHSKIPEPVEECPNVIYVGLTRAKKHMILCHHYKNNFLPFVDTEKIKIYSNYQILDELKIERMYTCDLILNKNVTDIVSYVDIDTVNCILTDFIEYKVNKTENHSLKFKNILIQTNNDNTNPVYEDLSSIIGQIIPIIAHCRYYGLDYLEYLEKFCKVTDFEGAYNSRYIKDFHKIIKSDSIDLKKFVYAIHIYFSYGDKYLHELQQLNGNYSWIDEDFKIYMMCASRILDNMKAQELKGFVAFEFPISYKFSIEPFEITLSGFIDCLYREEHTIIEYKCAEFKDSHLLQILVYGCLYYIIFKEIPTLKLYYPLSDTTIEVNVKDIDTNCHTLLKKLISQKINLECDLGSITFTSGMFRGFTFNELFNRYKSDNSILTSIEAIINGCKFENYKKECKTFLYYLKENENR